MDPVTEITASMANLTSSPTSADHPAQGPPEKSDEALLADLEALERKIASSQLAVATLQTEIDENKAIMSAISAAVDSKRSETARRETKAPQTREWLQKEVLALSASSAAFNLSPWGDAIVRLFEESANDKRKEVVMMRVFGKTATEEMKQEFEEHLERLNPDNVEGLSAGEQMVQALNRFVLHGVD
ncbi:hypothetical protein K402DRAFT_149137 [Aulographum hederae CBS 113979]|uniref:Uncharacterized protein n=1 Tax=Aulographum hederae CBS 113979 TaxID=1176131 RepID=A0A6G1GTE7_9PEZI|nr:hypothetical protein K402DRAFT_149137 [Aulographum hederae CBS 113979]